MIIKGINDVRCLVYTFKSHRVRVRSTICGLLCVKMLMIKINCFTILITSLHCHDVIWPVFKINSGESKPSTEKLLLLYVIGIGTLCYFLG